MNKKLTVLLVGGAGYIGSHMALNLLEKQYQGIVLDNLSTGHKNVLSPDTVFIKGSLDNKTLLSRVSRLHCCNRLL